MAEERKKTVLTISVDPAFEKDVVSNLILDGYQVEQVRSHAKALSLLEEETVDIILLDIEGLPTQEMDIVHYSKSRSAHTEIVVLSSIKEIENARNALNSGASFYLIKPVTYSEIRKVLNKLASRVDQQKAYRELEQQFLSDLMAGNEGMEKVLKLTMKIAPTSSTVLMGGESGTGKEFFARIIHRMSKRATDHFVPVNCGAIPDTLFESELFGHKRGSFTGADRDKNGLVEEAHLGTLFLDEVGELSPSAQVKLLRFLQEKTFRRVGDTESRTVNVRVIAATNRDLMQMIKEGSFREDLYYRLNVFYLHLPPLRERKETIPSLVKLFVHRYNSLLGKEVKKISKAAEAVLANYNYPGNVRELENIIEHAVVLADNNEITENDLPEFMFSGRLLLSAPDMSANGGEVSDLKPLEDVEKEYLTYALQKMSFNYSETAKKLNISRSTLWRKIKTYEIPVPE